MSSSDNTLIVWCANWACPMGGGRGSDRSTIAGSRAVEPTSEKGYRNKGRHKGEECKSGCKEAKAIV